MKKRYLTKSRFVSAIECPTKLFYLNKKEYKNIKNEDSFLASLARGGYQIGALAKFLFKDGIEIIERDHELALEATNEFLKKENVVIYEGAVKFDNFFVRADIIEKKGNQINLYEVKAKSFNTLKPNLEGVRGSINAEFLSYLQDVAFQTWIIRKAFPKFEISSFLVMPDKSKIIKAENLNQMFKINQNNKVSVTIPSNFDIFKEANNLLAKISVNSIIARIINTPLEFPGGVNTFEDAANLWANAYRSDLKINPSIGPHCRTCEFRSEIGSSLKSGFHECWKESLNWTDKDFEDGTVLDIFKLTSKTKDEFISQGIYKLKQLTKDDFKEFDDQPNDNGLSLKQRQWFQVDGVPKEFDAGGFFFHESYYRNEKAKWKYPLHMIDFETTRTAIPFYKYMRPYQQIAFQFSHHVLNEDGSVIHQDQFLCAEPGKFPSYEFVRALMHALSKDQGTVFRWAHHENTTLNNILEELANDIDAPDDKNELIEFIKTIIKGGIREMVDLCGISSNCFYHEYTKGRSSLKVVLPALFKSSEFLRDTYSKPIYGHPNGIQSINFKSDKGFTWFEPHTNNYDPYLILKNLAYSLLPDNIDEFLEENSSIIAEGGSAAIAYERLQYENLNTEERNKIKESLLRYCELDTLAMAMVIQAWDHI